MRRLGPLLIVPLFVAISAPTAAAERALGEALSVGSNRCFDAPHLAERVSALRGRSTVPDGLHISIQLTDDAATIALSFDRETKRELPLAGASCEERLSAVALAAALALDAATTAPTREPPRQPPPIALLTPTVPPPPAETKTPTATPALERATRGVGLSVGLGVYSELLASPVFAVTPTVEVSFSQYLEARVGAFIASPQMDHLVQASLQVSLAAVDLQACGAFPVGAPMRPRLSRFRLQFCGGALLGNASADAPIDQVVTPNSIWAVAYTRIGARVAIYDRLGVEIGARAMVPMIRPNLSIQQAFDGSTETYQVGRTVGLAFEAGPHIAF